MKTKLFSALTAVWAVLCAVGCAADDTTDLLPPPELTGETRTIAIIPALSVGTRTQLSDDHSKLLWEQGDTFGIITSADGEMILENIEAPEYVEGQDSYTVRVSAQAKYICCYYPYSEDVKIGYMIGYGLSSQLPQSYTTEEGYTGDFFDAYHFMSTPLQSLDGGSITANFTPIVSIIEFNIYGCAADEDLAQLTFMADDCTGYFRFDVSGETPAADPSTTYSSLTLNVPANTLRLSAGASKEEGVKVYGTVFKKNYEKPTVMLKTERHTYIFSFEGDIDCTADGTTVNLNIEKGTIPGNALVSELIASATSPWTASVTVEKDSGCRYYVLGAIATADFNEDTFIRQAVSSIEQAKNSSFYPYVTYYVGTESGTFDETYLYFDALLTGEPKGLKLSPETEYTVMVYAEGYDGQSYSTYSKFTTPAVSVDPQAAVKITIDATADYKSAEAVFTAENCERLFYGYTAGTLSDDSAVLAQITPMRGRYTEPVKQTVYFGNDDVITLFAAGIDAEGRFGGVVRKEVHVREINHNSSATVTSFSAGTFTPNPYNVNSGMLQLNIGLSADAEKLYIYDVQKSQWNKDDLASLPSNLVSGTAYSRSDVQSGISINYTQAYTEHLLFAMVEDAAGDFSPVLNLMDLSLTVSDAAFTTTVLLLEKAAKEFPSYWTQTIGGTAEEWLSLTDVKVPGDYGNDTWQCTVNSNGPTDGVEKVYIFTVSIDGATDVSNAYEIACAVADDFELYDYGTGLFDIPNYARLYDGAAGSISVSTGTKWLNTAQGGYGTAIVVVAGDADGNLSMKAAATVNSKGTVIIVDLSSAIVVQTRSN